MALRDITTRRAERGTVCAAGTGSVLGQGRAVTLPLTLLRPEPRGKILREKPYCGTNGRRKNFNEDKTLNQPPTKTKTNEKIKILC